LICDLLPSHFIMNKILFLLLVLFFSAFAQQISVLTDARDGKKYKTVEIGNQMWMAENLNYDIKGSKCYDNKPDNCAKYGRLYNWQTANTACPNGWHLPSRAEWEALTMEVGGKKRKV